MALVPTRWTTDTLTDYEAPEEFAEALGSVTVTAGWYDAPGIEDPILLEREVLVRNHVGWLNRRDVERWTYTLPGAPPEFYHRETYGRAYIPGAYGIVPGSAPVLLEVVDETFYPWSQFQPGSPNLSRRRTVAGWVIYDQRATADPLTTEERQELADRGLNPDGDGDLIVDSARPWSQALKLGEIVREPDAPQRAVWRAPFESETELVFQEPDRYGIVTVHKDHTRDGPPDVDGPHYQRRESWTYRLPVPLVAPELEATVVADAVRLELTGGGFRWQGRTTAPERYRVERRTVSEPARTTDPDPWDLYETPPAPSSRAVGLVEIDATDYDGTPSSSSPPDTGHTEPGDTAEPEPDAWSQIAEVDNDADAGDVGHAAATDADVVSGAVYEYRALSVYGSEQSEPSTPVRVAYGGATRSGAVRLRARLVPAGESAAGAIEVDGVAGADADDELAEEYGETVVYDLPVDVDTVAEAEDVAEPIVTAQLARSRVAALELDLTTTDPLILLERGQRIATPAVEYTTTGNGLVITSETEARTWRLDGFRLAIRRNASGELGELGTVLYLCE